MAKDKVILDVSGDKNVFESSYVGGATRVSGEENQFQRTVFTELQQGHPFWFWFGIVGAAASLGSLLIIIF